MRTRNHDWLCSRGYKPQYGFQVFHEGKWKEAAENGKPCIYDTQEERDRKRAEFRKMKTLPRITALPSNVK